MGRIDVIVPDELEMEFRIAATRQFGGKKGYLSEAIVEAVKDWVEKKKGSR